MRRTTLTAAAIFAAAAMAIGNLYFFIFHGIVVAGIGIVAGSALTVVLVRRWQANRPPKAGVENQMYFWDGPEGSFVPASASVSAIANDQTLETLFATRLAIPQSGLPVSGGLSLGEEEVLLGWQPPPWRGSVPPAPTDVWPMLDFVINGLQQRGRISVEADHEHLDQLYWYLPITVKWEGDVVATRTFGTDYPVTTIGLDSLVRAAGHRIRMILRERSAAKLAELDRRRVESQGAGS